MKNNSEHDSNYTLQIKFVVDGEPTPLISLHFESLQDAFDKFVMVQEAHFRRGFKDVEPFRSMKVFEALIIDNKDGTRLISSMVAPDNFDEGEKMTNGFYFWFPQTVSDFERIAGIDLSGFKSYDRDSDILMCSGHQQLIGYENLIEKAMQKMSDSTLLVVSLTRYYYETDGDRSGKLQSLPYRDDYFFDDPDKALQQLLTTDFNSLDQQVAWENDLDSYISEAKLYKNSGSVFDTDYPEATLHSARRNGLKKGDYDRYKVTGIYIGLGFGFDSELITYPFSKLENVRGSKFYKVGTYNDSLSWSQKVPGLLAPFEKNRKRNTQSQAKQPRTKKGTRKSI